MRYDINNDKENKIEIPMFTVEVNVNCDVEVSSK
jgi:hypothetical protein